MMSQPASTGEYMPDWVDTTFGKNQWIVPLNYWMGCFCIVLGLYVLGLIIFGKLSDLTSILVTLASIIFFVGVGSILVLSMRNVIDRVRSIKCSDGLYRVEFWWRGKRKGLEFTVSDVERVGSCKQPKGIKQWFASLPREPICYWIYLRDGTDFQVAGKDEEIHEIVKCFSERKGKQN